MAQRNPQNYYSNPAFCQKSEFYSPTRRSPQKQLSPQRALSPHRALSPQRALTPHRALSPQRNLNPQRALSPQRTSTPQKVPTRQIALSPQNLPQQNYQVRQPPVGAQTPVHILDTSIGSHLDDDVPLKINQDEECYEEQEFYEEMLVDDTTGVVQQKSLIVVSSEGNSRRATPIQQQLCEDQCRNGSRYASAALQEEVVVNQKNRYEYVPMQERNPQSSPVKSQRVHRYAVIPSEEEQEDFVPKPSGRYALVPVEDLTDNRYYTITQKEIQNRRYEYIKEDEFDQNELIEEHTRPPQIVSSPQVINNERNRLQCQNFQSPSQIGQRPPNPIATQKLYDLLQTPRKSRSNTSRTPQKLVTPQHQRSNMQTSPLRSNMITPNVTPNKGMARPMPKAQQKLNYALGSRQIQNDKRNTAIVAPICSSPAQSVYSETTFSQKTESWMNLSHKKPPVQMTLAIAAFMMILCGGVTTSLCFYMISIMGRLYFLDFGVISGFTCLILGLLGFRTRHCYWLPNRNYIAGYVVLSVFSLLTCVGLLVLLSMQPKPGTPLADMTSGAVCGTSVVSLILASSGVIASYCCKHPPPDNRVEHLARGFTI